MEPKHARYVLHKHACMVTQDQTPSQSRIKQQTTLPSIFIGLNVSGAGGAGAAATPEARIMAFRSEPIRTNLL